MLNINNIKITLLLILVFPGCIAKKNNNISITSSAVYLNGLYLGIDKCETGEKYRKIYTGLLTHNNRYPTELVFGGVKSGKCNKGKEEGVWITKTIWYYDEYGNPNTKDLYKHREEYFNDGLQDGEYKIYNNQGDVIYETKFKKGNGIEKDYHANGKLYYSIEKKDGYFIDTLKLYDDMGRLAEEFLYRKDSLVYQKKYRPTYQKPAY